MCNCSHLDFFLKDLVVTLQEDLPTDPLLHEEVVMLLQSHCIQQVDHLRERREERRESEVGER